MNIAATLVKLVDWIIPPVNHSRTHYVDIGKECFAGITPGYGTVICWRGENYIRQQPSWRVLLANWLHRKAYPGRAEPSCEGPSQIDIEP